MKIIISALALFSERDASTKLPADVKVGSKVTIYYSMNATEVEAKPTKTK